MRRTATLVLASAALALASLPSVALAGVPHVKVAVNRGVGGATLGMTKAQVRSILGNPEQISGQGRVFEWQDADSLLGVYFNPSKRARLFIVNGSEYCTGFGLCLEQPNGVRKLRQRYGTQLVKKVNPDGLACYQLLGQLNGRPVFTTFLVESFKAKAAVYSFAILFGTGDVC